MSGDTFADFAWRYVNDERMDDATFRSLIRHHPAVTDLPTYPEPEGGNLQKMQIGSPEPEGWKDIATAPKDGTPVLLSLEYGGMFHRYIGRWHPGLKCWFQEEFSSSVFPAHMQGWFKHWQPLPASPEGPKP
jgi:hypothetical protein